MAIEELSNESIESVELSREMVAGLLRPYIEAREQEASYGKQKSRLGELIKNYIETHDGEVVWDGENLIEAVLKERRIPGRDYDLVTMWERDRAMFERLVLTGCLKVDEAAVKRAGQNVGGVGMYAFPEKKTQALNVEVKK